MLAQPDEGTIMGWRLHWAGVECTDKNSAEEAHCVHSFKVEEKASGDGYIGPPAECDQ